MSKKKILKILSVVAVLVIIYFIIPAASLGIKTVEFDESKTYFSITNDMVEQNSIFLEAINYADRNAGIADYGPMTISIFTAQQVVFSLPQGESNTIFVREYIEYNDKYYYIVIAFLPGIFLQGP